VKRSPEGDLPAPKRPASKYDFTRVRFYKKKKKKKDFLTYIHTHARAHTRSTKSASSSSATRIIRTQLRSAAISLLTRCQSRLMAPLANENRSLECLMLLLRNTLVRLTFLPASCSSLLLHTRLLVADYAYSIHFFIHIGQIGFFVAMVALYFYFRY